MSNVVLEIIFVYTAKICFSNLFWLKLHLVGCTFNIHWLHISRESCDNMARTWFQIFIWPTIWPTLNKLVGDYMGLKPLSRLVKGPSQGFRPKWHTHTSVEIMPNPRLDPSTNKRALVCGNIQDQPPRGPAPTSQTKLIIHVHAPVGQNPRFGRTLWYHVITWDHSWLLNGHMICPNTWSEKTPTCSPLEAGQRSRC